MKVSEAIDRLEVGETVWVKATLDMINDKGRYVRVMPNVSSVYLDGHDEISLTEPTPLDSLAQEYDVEPDTIREWLDKGHKGSFEKVVVTEEEVAMIKIGKKAKMSVYAFLNSVLPMEKAYDDRLARAFMDGYTVKPKRWVVKFGSNLAYYFNGWYTDASIRPNGHSNKGDSSVMVFTDRAKAEAVATLVEGTVEEL